MAAFIRRRASDEARPACNSLLSSLAGDSFAQLKAESLDDQKVIARFDPVLIGSEAFAEDLEPPSTSFEPNEGMFEFVVSTHVVNLSPVNAIRRRTHLAKFIISLDIACC